MSSISAIAPAKLLNRSHLKSDSNSTAKRHQSDSNSLTPAHLDAILESVEAIARLMPTTLNRRARSGYAALRRNRDVSASSDSLASRGPLGRREPVLGGRI